MTTASEDITETLALLPPLRKAAILMVRIGVENAIPLLKALKRSELTQLINEVARLGRIDVDLGQAILVEFVDASRAEALPRGDQELAYNYLQSTFGDRTAREILGELTGGDTIPFQFLDSMEAGTVAENLIGEHPQTVALVLSHLQPEQAAEIISNLPTDFAVQVGLRLSTMDRVTSDALAAVEDGLRHRFAAVLENKFLEATGGVDSLVEVIALSDKAVEEVIMTGLTEYDADLAAEIRAKLFVFDDLQLLTDRQMQLVLRTVDSSQLPLALKGVSVAVKDKILNNLSSRARENLLDEIELLGSVRMSDVEEAQSGILEIVRNLEESGELVIDRGGGDFVS